MKNKKILLTIFISGILIFVWGIIKIITFPPLVSPAKLVEIPENSTAYQIAEILYKNRVIKKISWFLYITNKMKVQDKLKSGIYEFSGRIPLKKVVEKLVKGEVKLVKVTIPEGTNIMEIGEILKKKGVIKNKDEFISYAKEKKLEGFLFPDTYLFPLNSSVESVSHYMWERFNEVWKKLTGEEITDENYKKVKKIVTVASIVEKEAIFPDEKRIIAGIIYKRLKKGLPIQSCATVEYAIGNHKPRLTEKDLKIKSPYNTYLFRGLPPTPICNPGRTSLKASLNPRKTEYLYFLSMGNGRNHFSKTYKEHLRAKRIYFSNMNGSVKKNTEKQ